MAKAKSTAARSYKKVSCHKTATTAKTEAKKLRAQGKTAQVRGNCVYSAGARRKGR
jgi:hypothetical protein